MMGRGLGSLLLFAALALAAAPAGAVDPMLGELPDALGPASDPAANAPVSAPPLPDARSATAAAPEGARDLVASLLGAIGAVGSGLAAAVGALASAGGAVMNLLAAILAAIGNLLGLAAGALGSALGALAQGLAWALGALAGAVATLAALLAGAAGQGAAAVARDPRLAAPIAGAAAVGAVAWWAKLGKFAPLMGLFSRLQTHELLQNDVRQRIYDFIRERPGAHVSQVSGTMGLGWGTTVYHLGRMRDGQLLTARRVGNQLCHFVNGGAHHTAQEQTMLAVAKAPKANAILDYLKLRGPSAQNEIARELGMSSALVSWYARRLEEMGVVHRVRTGRTCTLALPGPAATAHPAPAPPRARPADPAPLVA